MNITYLLGDTSMSGGIRVVLAQADALVARGHRVRLVTPGAPLTWRPSRAEWIYLDNFLDYDARDEDFVVGTFWSTVGPAYEIARERAVHLSQGYEGAFTAYQPIKAQIDAAYSLPIPKLVVAKPLVDVLRPFGAEVHYVGQIVEDEFYRAQTPPERHPPRVLVCGQAQGDMKGVEDAYGAVAHARWFHQKLDLIRVSPWVPSREEPLEAVQEFHVALSTAEMTRLMHSCDILIAPNHREEGFGLPAAEAMASGIPCLVTSIPSYLSFDAQHDFALFAPEENPVELGERLIELLEDEDLRERLRSRGREVAEQWRVERVADRLEEFFGGR